MVSTNASTLALASVVVDGGSPWTVGRPGVRANGVATNAKASGAGVPWSTPLKSSPAAAAPPRRQRAAAQPPFAYQPRALSAARTGHKRKFRQGGRQLEPHRGGDGVEPRGRQRLELRHAQLNLAHDDGSAVLQVVPVPLLERDGGGGLDG